MASPGYIENSRRAPRTPARCRAKIICPAGVFEAETEDIGSQGCQIVSPRAMRRGEPMKITLAHERLSDVLQVAARVAWASSSAPWRVGVAFEDHEFERCERWFDRLVASFPGLTILRRIPDRIPVDTMVYLGPPPRFLVDFDRHEAAILRAIGSGTSVGELMAQLKDEWPAKQRALFSLLAHQHLTLSRGASVHPDSWKRILADLESSLAVEGLRQAPPPLAAPVYRPPSARMPAASPFGPRPLPHAGPPPLPTAAGPALTPAPEARGTARGIDAGNGWAAGGSPRHTPPPDFMGAGVGWRGISGGRTPEAQACFDRAREEIRAGRVGGALALLRKALAMSPGDAEIAGELGKLAFK